MSLSMGGSNTQGSQSQNTAQAGFQNPWGATIPGLQNILSQAQAAYHPGINATQQGAFSQLQQNANAGDPNAGALRNLSTQLLGDASANPDPTKTPGMQGLLATIRNDVGNSVNGQFAAAGRDMSGANSQALARGLAQGEAAPLLGQYNQNIQNQLAQGQAGVGAGQAALAAQNYAPNATLALQQQQQQLPFGNLGMLASLFYPAAGLGGSSWGQGKSVGTSSSTTFGGKAGFNFTGMGS